MKKKLISALLALSCLATVAFALTGTGISGSWYHALTAATYTAKATSSMKCDITTVSWIQDAYGYTLVDEVSSEATNATYCNSTSSLSLQKQPITRVGRGKAYFWTMPGTAGDYENPADYQTCSTKKDLPASVLSEEAQQAYEEGLRLVNAQKDAIIESFGLDLAGYEKFMLTESEDHTAEIEKIASSVFMMADLKAGDSPRQCFLNPEKDLMYIMHQDAAEVNHLITFEYQEQQNGGKRWVKTDEATTQAYGVKNADVHQAVEEYETALFNLEAE